MSFGQEDGSHPVLHRGRLAVATPPPGGTASNHRPSNHLSHRSRPMRSNTKPRSAVRRLALARLISITGGAAAFAALNFTVYERTGSAAWLSASLLLTFGVRRVRAARRDAGRSLRPQAVMIASDLAGAGCFLALAFVHEPALLLALGFVAAVVEAPFWSASAAAIPNLVGKDDLAWANGLLQIGGNAGIMLGPALGGVLLAAVGRDGVRAERPRSSCRPRSSRSSADGSRRIGPSDDEHRGFRAGFVFIARDRVLRTIVLGGARLRDPCDGGRRPARGTVRRDRPATG